MHCFTRCGCIYFQIHKEKNFDKEEYRQLSNSLFYVNYTRIMNTFHRYRKTVKKENGRCVLYTAVHLLYSNYSLTFQWHRSIKVPLSKSLFCPFNLSSFSAKSQRQYMVLTWTEEHVNHPNVKALDQSSLAQGVNSPVSITTLETCNLNVLFFHSLWLVLVEG